MIFQTPRHEKLLAGLEKSGLGLEIGALNRPALRRPKRRVLYADHAGSAALRAKYADHANVVPADIVEVDVVWQGSQALRDATPEMFDHVVASHVIEHVPDLVWWMAEIASVLRLFGSLRLAVPDRRYTFDFLRRESTLPDVMASHLARQTRPGVREILDFWGWYRAVNAAAAWRGEYPADRDFHMHEMQAALQRCTTASQDGAYHDVHCWVFTPASFAVLMSQLCQLGLLDYGCTQIHVTARDELEFFVHLMKMEDRAAMQKSWDWAVWMASHS